MQRRMVWEKIWKDGKEKSDQRSLIKDIMLKTNISPFFAGFSRWKRKQRNFSKHIIKHFSALQHIATSNFWIHFSSSPFPSEDVLRTYSQLSTRYAAVVSQQDTTTHCIWRSIWLPFQWEFQYSKKVYFWKLTKPKPSDVGDRTAGCSSELVLVGNRENQDANPSFVQSTSRTRTLMLLSLYLA